ncbi:hypothetical protein F7725_008944, partial [Dissostichus mawsoni]
MGDENNDFFKTCFDCDDPDISNSSIWILTVIPEDSLASPDSLHLAPSAIASILEGKMVMDDINTLPDAMCLLFRLIYALNLQYPQQLRTLLNVFKECCSHLAISPLNQNYNHKKCPDAVSQSTSHWDRLSFGK